MSDLRRQFDQLGRLPSDERVRALETIIPLALVQAVLAQTGHASRHYRALPAWFVVWLVIGLGLFPKDSHRQVFKHLQRFRRGHTPGRSTLREARRGLGVAPLRLVAQRVVKLLGQADTPGAFHRGMRLMALDSFILDLPDSPENARVFGRPASGRGDGAFPQARVLALCETGSHVLYRWLVKPHRRSEVVMAAHLLRYLETGMLLLWDRGLLSYDNVRQVVHGGAHLLARIKGHLIFVPTQTLADGSYLAKLYPSARQRDRDEGGIVVRIIEYTLDDASRPNAGEPHRILTTLLDAATDPAVTLVVLYHERWEEEVTIDEVKTHQQEKALLHSRTPAGVVQEIEGLMLAHYAVRALMHQAAAKKGLDPQRLSFVGALKILRCRLAEVPSDEAGRQNWLEDVLAEMAEEVLPPRRDRVNPRVIKRKMSKWPKKRPHHRRPPQPTRPFRESVVIT